MGGKISYVKYLDINSKHINLSKLASILELTNLDIRLHHQIGFDTTEDKVPVANWNCRNSYYPEYCKNPWHKYDKYTSSWKVLEPLTVTCIGIFYQLTYSLFSIKKEFYNL